LPVFGPVLFLAAAARRPSRSACNVIPFLPVGPALEFFFLDQSRNRSNIVCR
jgi:hypothetical protein